MSRCRLLPLSPAPATSAHRPSAVRRHCAPGLAWHAYEKAKETGADVLIVETAGRLQNKAELMAELEKIVGASSSGD